MKAQIFILLALVAGGLLSLQGAINANLGKAMGNPFHAGFVSFAVGLLTAFAGLYVTGARLPAMTNLMGHPWYLYVGGALGVIYVTSVLMLIPKLGAANVVLAVFLGQIVASMLIDHFGLLGLARVPMDWYRAGGAGLMLAGLYLVQYRA